MLTATTRDIFDKSNERETFTAHVIRIPAATEGEHAYYLGVSTAAGEPIGMARARTGSVLRTWKRLSALEEYLQVFGRKLVAITVYPMPSPERAVRDRLVKQYRLDKTVDDAAMDVSRKVLLAALQKRAAIDGRAPDPTDA